MLVFCNKKTGSRRGTCFCIIAEFTFPDYFYTPSPSLDHFHNGILIKFAAVECQMILGKISPFPVCEIFVVGATFFVYFFHQFLGTFFFTAGAFHDRLYTILIWCMDKYAETFILKNMVCTTSDNYAVLLCLRLPE